MLDSRRAMRLQRAGELLMNPQHRDIRIRNIREASRSSYPLRRFRDPVEELNEVVWLGREDYRAMETWLSEVDERFRSSQPTAEEIVDAARAKRRSYTRVRRMREQMIREIVALSTGSPLMTRADLAEYMKQVSRQWHSEFESFVEDDPSRTAADFHAAKDKELFDTLTELTILSGGDPRDIAERFGCLFES